MLERVLRRHGGVNVAVLFGSRATGRSTESSDADVAVDAPAADLDALAAELSAELGLEVDLMRLPDATIPLLEALVRDGVVVFEGHRGAGAAWRSRVFCELETDRNAIGPGNVVAHGYAGLDIERCFRAATEGIEDLDVFARQVGVWVASR